MACKRCRTVNTKLTDLINLTNLCYLKTYELEFEATSAFVFSVEIMWYNRLRKIRL